MNEKFEEFKQKYPNLFKENPRSGFYLSLGWETLVHTLCSILESQIERLPEEVRSNICCAQCKSKFGNLRFYMTNETPEISGTISMAEAISAHICEECGQRGKTRPGRWIETLCDICLEKRDKRKTT